MTCRRDEVKADVDAIIAEPGIALDSGFFRKNVIVYAFEVPKNLLKTLYEQDQSCVENDVSDAYSPCFVVNLVSEARGVNNRK